MNDAKSSRSSAFADALGLGAHNLNDIFESAPASSKFHGQVESGLSSESPKNAVWLSRAR